MFDISERSIILTCFVGSASYLMGAHCARVVCIMFSEDLLHDQC